MLNKKIAFVGNSSLTMYNFRISLLKALVINGFDVTVIAPKDSDTSLYTKENIHYIPIEIECKGMNPIKDIQLVYQLRKIYNKENFSFIFHYTIKPVIYGSFAASMLKIPHISVITGLGYTFIRKGFIKNTTIFLYSLSLKKAKEIWFLNLDDMDVFVQEKIIHKDRTYLLNGEGVDTSIYRSQKKKKKFFSFIFIGRVLWDKGIAEYIDAARILKKKYPEIHFQILGPLGAENPAAIKPEEMQTWVNEGIIDYLGETRDVTPYIANCDCVVLPSYREGLSRILLEAAAMERPVIASNVAGCKEIIEHEKSGYLCTVRSSDSLMKLMEKMYKLSDEERKKMGNEGRKIILEKFDDKIIIDVYRMKLNKYLK